MHKRQDAGTGRKLAVYFPGIGYHCDKPLLYYSRRLAKEAGYEELQLSYTFSGGNIRGNKEKMREAFFTLYDQAAEQLADVNWESWDEVLFVSKSIGTIISAAYAAKQHIPCRQILYTPLEDTFRIEEELGLTREAVQDRKSAGKENHAIAFIGTADPWSKVPQVISLSEEKGIPIFSYEGANHSLETGNVLACLDILTDVMAKTSSFLHRI